MNVFSILLSEMVDHTEAFLGRACSEDSRDEARVSVAQSCSYVWQTYEEGVRKSSFTGQEEFSVFAYFQTF